MAYRADGSFTTREVTHSPTQWSGCYSEAPTSFPPRSGCDTAVARARSTRQVSFGEVLRKYRVAARLTQEALAERSG